MSNKAYFLRLRTEKDIQALKKYEACKAVPFYFNFILKCTKNIKGFKKGDYVAAITVDRSNLRWSMLNEAGIKGRLYYQTIYDIPPITSEEGNGFMKRANISHTKWHTKVSKLLKGKSLG